MLRTFSKSFDICKTARIWVLRNSEIWSGAACTKIACVGLGESESATYKKPVAKSLRATFGVFVESAEFSGDTYRFRKPSKTNGR